MRIRTAILPRYSVMFVKGEPDWLVYDNDNMQIVGKHEIGSDAKEHVRMLNREHKEGKTA